jgi:hypothetical protein
MKMTLFAALIAVSTTSFGSQAKSIKIEMKNDNFETKVCYQAATKGLSSAKRMLKDNSESYYNFNRAYTCNGLSLYKMARKYHESPGESNTRSNIKSEKRYKLIARIGVASKVCVDAVSMGIDSAIAKNNISPKDAFGFSCNKRSIKKFVERYNGRIIVAG